jgi:hypothetical protein
MMTALQAWLVLQALLVLQVLLALLALVALRVLVLMLVLLLMLLLMQVMVMVLSQRLGPPEAAASSGECASPCTELTTCLHIAHMVSG